MARGWPQNEDDQCRKRGPLLRRNKANDLKVLVHNILIDHLFLSEPLEKCIPSLLIFECLCLDSSTQCDILEAQLSHREKKNLQTTQSLTQDILLCNSSDRQNQRRESRPTYSRYRPRNRVVQYSCRYRPHGFMKRVKVETPMGLGGEAHMIRPQEWLKTWYHSSRKII